MSDTSVENSRNSKVFLLLCFIPISVFFYIFFQYASNIPFQDDYDALLEPVTKFSQLSAFSWKDFITLIWTQDDERRIVLDRIVAIGMYLIHGRLDLRIQMFLGLLSLVGMLYIFYTIIRGIGLPLIFVLASALLLFHIQYYEAIFWGMIPLQHIIVYFFVLLASYHLFSPKPGHFILSILATILAILSDVSGTFILPAGVVLLVLQRRWMHTGLWILAIGAFIALYYYRLEVPAYRPKLSDNFQHPSIILHNFLAFSGLSFDTRSLFPSILRISLIIAAGSVLWGLFFYRGFSLVKTFFTTSVVSYPRWKITLWGGLLHIALTMLAFAVARAMDGTDAVLISRYKHIGFIWLILLSLLVFSEFSRKTIRTIAPVWLAFSVGIFLFSYFEYLAPLDYYYKERNTDLYGWEKNRALPSSPIYVSLRGPVDTITEAAVAAGIYQLPSPYFFEGPYERSSEAIDLKPILSGGTLLFTDQSYIRGGGKHDGAYIMLSHATQQHIIPTQQNRFSLKSYIFSLFSAYYANGFTGRFPVVYLDTNRPYALSVLTIKGNKKTLHPIPYQLTYTGSDVSIQSAIPQ